MDDLLEVESALERVEQAVENVERAVKDSTGGSARWLMGPLLAFVIVLGVMDASNAVWHSKLRYSLQHSVPTGRVTVDKQPHDCDFMTAPIGIKYCEYKPVVTLTRWAKSTTGDPIRSIDGGNTWTVFTPPAGAFVPKYSTLTEVSVSWQKNDQ